MHGYYKSLTGGLRTRDGHVMEWLSKTASERNIAVDVYSRAEPLGYRRWKMRGSTSEVLQHTRDLTPDVLALPNPRNPKTWWVKSAKYYKVPDRSGPSIVWNPMTALCARLRAHWESNSLPVHLDLLDDWSIHHDFRSIRSEVEEAYTRAFGLATSVTANSEGTIALAKRFGRTDAVLIPNGCDPEKFSSISTASGVTTVGYVGKIGDRLDIDLIRRTCASHPGYRFVFAGPVLGGDVGRELNHLDNVEMLGDIRYEEVPALLQTFDIGWVPHGVSKGQVGGDAIKIYEYRAAGLPVVSTPIIGTRERPLPGVLVAESDDHPSVIGKLVNSDGRADRIVSEIPEELTWRFKTETIVNLMNAGTGPNDR